MTDKNVFRLCQNSLQHLNNLLKEMCTDSLLVQEYIDGIECEVLVLQYKGKYYALDPVQILFKQILILLIQIHQIHTIMNLK